MTSIRSFTEMGLMNPTALNLLIPPHCEKTMIENPSPSVLQTVEENFKQFPLDHPVSGSKSHPALKSLRFVALTVYTLGVALILSSIGTAFYLFRIALSSTEWAFAKCLGLQRMQDAAAEKIKKFATLFFVDLANVYLFGTYAVLPPNLGISCLKNIISAPYYTLISYPVNFLLSLCTPLLLIGFPALIPLSLRDPDRFMAQMCGQDHNRAGMYLSLAFRRHFGICGKNGEPLPYGEEDHISFDYKRLDFSGPGRDKLIEFLVKAERELVDRAREADAYLTRSNTELTYTYPFKGHAIAGRVEACFNRSIYDISTRSNQEMPLSDQDRRDVKVLCSRLRLLDRKIKLLRKIYLNALALSSCYRLRDIQAPYANNLIDTIASPVLNLWSGENSDFLWLPKRVRGLQGESSFPIKLPPSFLSDEDYHTLFHPMGELFMS
ncbi:MAG: hypothetical protein WB791_09805 [Waddliaceae bacterium]